MSIHSISAQLTPMQDIISWLTEGDSAFYHVAFLFAIVAGLLFYGQISAEIRAGTWGGRRMLGRSFLMAIAVMAAVVVVILAGIYLWDVGGTYAAGRARTERQTAESAQGTMRGIPVMKPQPIRTSINKKDGAEMVLVPAGEFLMGSDYGRDCEKPLRTVYLDGYWIYKHEVTAAQYRRFCAATGRHMPELPGGDWVWMTNHPMVYTAWQDAADYAKWAGVHLPTEAQWEKAARGTDARVYPWGNAWDASKCANGVGGELVDTKPVGSYPSGASPYGCLDMAGNVYEWCSDWFDKNYYKTAPSRNPMGPDAPDSFGARVMHGGSFQAEQDDQFRCAYRYIYGPEYQSIDIGFRCARTL